MGTSTNHFDMEGGGFNQMSIFQHEPYLFCKMVNKKDSGSKMSKNLTTWFMDDP